MGFRPLLFISIGLHRLEACATIMKKPYPLFPLYPFTLFDFAPNL
jgi:hypothetical protein